MNSTIKEIASIFLKTENLSSMKDAQRVSNYFSILYTLCINNPKSRNHRDLERRLKETIFNSGNYYNMISDFSIVSARLTETAKKALFTRTKEIIKNAGDNDISWAYEYIKASIASFIQKKSGGSKSTFKICGENLLLTTQFFTDDYMIEYIVDSVFEQLKDSIPNVVFVDPACGGGNFLTYVSKKLFQWYTENTELPAKQIVEKIFKEQIVGYDLDPNIADIASLSLLLQKNKLYAGISSNPVILGGGNNNLGYLTVDIENNILIKAIDSHRKKGKIIAYVTNPPFMGGRDLDSVVKSYLSKNLPLGKGDLCASFMYRMMMDLKEGDILGTVLQNSWLFLSSYKELRRVFLDHYDLIKCADLGAHAFADIGGEKANVVLAVISKKSQPDLITQFINLRNKNYESKKNSLRFKDYNTTEVNCRRFLDEPDYAFNYELSRVFKTKPKYVYGNFAHIMQGTSTGDSKNTIKYYWEVPKENNEWTLVSKGGGFCKWAGLNYYKVLWGKDGDALKNNPGCALRNISEIKNTQLVYSDTGTKGLNVRQKRDNQVFIASGPGIHATIGYPECHQAFLNSKFATYWLKISNPKLTVSAGYIAKIPITKSLLYSKQLKSLAMQCADNKRQLLKGKLPNVECRLHDYSMIQDINKYIERTILSDLKNNYNILKAEFAINRIIYRSLHLSKKVVNIIECLTGENIMFNRLTLETVDQTLCEFLDINCQVIGTKKNRTEIGSDNLIELASSKLGCGPEVLYDFCIGNISQMKLLKQKYLSDLRHKVFLKANGVTDSMWGRPRAVIHNVADVMKQLCPSIGTLSDAEVLEIYSHHVKAFLNTPLLYI